MRKIPRKDLVKWFALFCFAICAAKNQGEVFAGLAAGISLGNGTREALHAKILARSLN